jgi:bifunctional DNA-binding transcriptional regulator/antitoxin component of YhaV-PrlF toxin-antitoxin module
MRTEVIEIGDSLGIMLPNEALARLGSKVGDELYLFERQGSLFLKRKNPQVERKSGGCDDVR